MIDWCSAPDAPATCRAGLHPGASPLGSGPGDAGCDYCAAPGRQPVAVDLWDELASRAVAGLRAAVVATVPGLDSVRKSVFGGVALVDPIT
jgi:hypothetical protein